MSKGINHTFSYDMSKALDVRCKHCKGFESEHPTIRCSNVQSWTYAVGDEVPFIRSEDSLTLYGVDGMKIGSFYYCDNFESEDSYEIRDFSGQVHRVFDMRGHEYAAFPQ